MLVKNHTFVRSLKKSGVPDEFIADMIEVRQEHDLINNISNRAKFSLGLNPETEHEGLRVIDLLNTDTAMLSQNYYRESAGGAALAKTGFKSYDHTVRTINEAELAGLKMGLDPKRNAEEATLLREGAKMLYGKPLTEDTNSLLNVSLRRGMSWSAQRFLNTVGLAQVPELARAMSMFGINEVLREIPSVAVFRRKAAREGGTFSGMLHDPINRDIEFAVGYVGEDTLLTPMHIRGEEASAQLADPSGRLGKLIDNALAIGSRIQNIISGFQFTQGSMEKIVHRAIYKKLIHFAESGGEVPFGKSQMTDEVGWTKEWFERFKEHHNSHERYDTFNGEKIRLIDHESMDVEMKDSFLLGMNRLRGRAIQANFIGDFSPWVDKPIGRALSQFRTFSIVSAEKQLIHDMRGNKIQAAQTAIYGSLLSYMAYSARVWIRASTKDDPQDFIDKAFDPVTVSWGVLNLLPQVAGPMLGAEFLGISGIVPDKFTAAPGRVGVPSSYSPPVLSGLKDTAKAVHSTVKAVEGTGESNKAVSDFLSLLPFSKAIGIGYITHKGLGLIE
jgi:hypothetical protein